MALRRALFVLRSERDMAQRHLGATSAVCVRCVVGPKQTLSGGVRRPLLSPVVLTVSGRAFIVVGFTIGLESASGDRFATVVLGVERARPILRLDMRA